MHIFKYHQGLLKVVKFHFQSQLIYRKDYSLTTLLLVNLYAKIQELYLEMLTQILDLLKYSLSDHIDQIVFCAISPLLYPPFQS